MNMQKIVFLDRQSLRAELRAPSFAHEWTEHVQTRPDQVVERLQHATVAISNKVPIRRDTLAQLPNLKMIAMAATGYDVIDIDACRERGVAVANIRNYAVHTVPEHAFALIFALRRNLMAYRQDVLNGRWQTEEQFCLTCEEVKPLAEGVAVLRYGSFVEFTCNECIEKEVK
jgi:glycerate dehydrogenase